MAAVTARLRADLGRLRSYPRRAYAAVEAVVVEFTALITRDAQGNAPVDSGDLRSTIRGVLEQAAQAVAARIVAGGIPGAATGRLVDYALFVELGTANAAAQPFLFPAFERHRLPFIEAVRRAVEGAA